MDHAETDELGLFQTGNQPEHPGLLAPFQLRLKAHEAEVIAGQIVLPQLHRGERRTTGARIHQADRLHRSEAQRVNTAMGHDLDGQTPFEESLLVEVVHRRRFRVDEGLVESTVLLARERAIEIVSCAVVNPAGLVSAEAAAVKPAAKRKATARKRAET